jgi:hypothetical protein
MADDLGGPKAILCDAACGMIGGACGPWAVAVADAAGRRTGHQAGALDAGGTTRDRPSAGALSQAAKVS